MENRGKSGVLLVKSGDLNLKLFVLDDIGYFIGRFFVHKDQNLKIKEYKNLEFKILFYGNIEESHYFAIKFLNENEVLIKYLYGTKSHEEIIIMIKKFISTVSSYKELSYFKSCLIQHKNSDEQDVELLMEMVREAGIPTSPREEFYASKFKVTTFTSVEEMISDFDPFLGVLGVWAVKCGSQVLDVCETQDIGNEMYQVVHRLSFMRGKTDEEIQSMNNSYNRTKVRDIANEGKLDFVLIVRDVNDKTEREKIESQYAHDTKAKYWNPAPNQNIYQKNLL